MIEAQFVAEIARHATDPKLVEAVVCAAREQLGERRKSLADEARAVRRAIKDSEREIERGAGEGGSAHIDGRIGELRGRLAEIERERGAVEATTVEAEAVARLLVEDFTGVWQAMNTRERRIVVKSVIPTQQSSSSTSVHE